MSDVKVSSKTVWYNPKFDCLGILEIWNDRFLHFEIQTQSGPIGSTNFLKEEWVQIGQY